MEGERKLMFAVLEDGVRGYLKNMEARSRRARILFLEVRDRGIFGAKFLSAKISQA